MMRWQKGSVMGYIKMPGVRSELLCMMRLLVGHDKIDAFGSLEKDLTEPKSCHVVGD
jgi:hypothetical protein